MAYRDQPFVGVVDAGSILKENFIIAGGNFASGSPQIADFSVSSGDSSLLRVGQTIYSVAGAVPTNATITNINGSLITMDTTASANAAGDTIGISLPSGSYLFQSASFTDPNNEITVGDITGSDTGSFDYAILGVAKRNNSTRKGVFHIYEISEVVQTNIGASEISFFVEWGEEGTEADSGDTLQTAENIVALVNLTDTGSIAPGFSRAIAGLEDIKDGSEYAGFNIAISQYLSDLSGSSGTSATGSFSGSFTGSLDGTASIADFATTASHVVTASFADTATTASLALEAITASLALQADSASVAARATTLSTDATASFADRATSASIADELSQLATASYAITASHALNIPQAHTASFALQAESASVAARATTLSSDATASFADSATTASIADALSQLATASHALTAVTASHAISASYAVSASVEIIKEISSSFADTASFAQGGQGFFSGAFSASNFTFDGDTLIVSGNVFVDGTLDAATKNFRIQHPTMEGYYLIHSSLEGPERGIYYRGKLKTNNIIHLPDYWDELTDDTDITVQLTAIGNACQHFVKSVTKKEIEVGCDCGKPHCYYIVHAQRFNEGRLDILKPKVTKGL